MNTNTTPATTIQRDIRHRTDCRAPGGQPGGWRRRDLAIRHDRKNQFRTTDSDGERGRGSGSERPSADVPKPKPKAPPSVQRPPPERTSITIAEAADGEVLGPDDGKLLRSPRFVPGDRPPQAVFRIVDGVSQVGNLRRDGRPLPSLEVQQVDLNVDRRRPPPRRQSPAERRRCRPSPRRPWPRTA